MILWFNPRYIVCIYPFHISNMLIWYIVFNTLIMGKTARIWEETTGLEEYMIYIGIDMAKRKFDYCIINSEMNKLRTGIIINNSNGLREFLGIIKIYGNIRIGMESTNIYHLNLYNYLINRDYKPVLLNSIETKMMKKSRIRKNKKIK